jgi:hypothetical protein
MCPPSMNQALNSVAVRDEIIIWKLISDKVAKGIFSKIMSKLERILLEKKIRIVKRKVSAFQ